MKVLIVNKFLHPNGGSETYIFKLGEELQRQGHEVQFFGMEHEGRIVGNRVNSYTSNMDFHGGSKLSKILYPLKTIYSFEARKALRKVLDDFVPDILHVNNFNYQLTPSILVEARKWEKRTGHKIKIVYTAHDYQIVCPNHMLNNPNTNENCEKCLGGHYGQCCSNRCIHGSVVKSLIGTMEAVYWNSRKVYKEFDVIICPSDFLKSKLDTNPILAERTRTVRNFIDVESVDHLDFSDKEAKDYVLYFGRFAEEKGIRTFMESIDCMKEKTKIVFAGKGPLEEEVNSFCKSMTEKGHSVCNVGFRTGQDLQKLICNAMFTVYPSTWYENGPFSIMESQAYGVPVIGSALGGIPELIEDGITGRLFDCGDAQGLAKIMDELVGNPQTVTEMSACCAKLKRRNCEEYTKLTVDEIYLDYGDK